MYYFYIDLTFEKKQKLFFLKKGATLPPEILSIFFTDLTEALSTRTRKYKMAAKSWL